MKEFLNQSPAQMLMGTLAMVTFFAVMVLLSAMVP
jgi:hypothetical protein